MFAFFEWLDARPALYWAIAWSSFALCLLAACVAQPDIRREPKRSWMAHAAVFAGLVLLTLCAFRWPSWFAPEELNPDESQILAGAITLREEPVFWKSVDGTTHGPLNEYLLTAASLAGLPLTYLGARLMAALLIAGILLGVWGALRHLLPEHLARLGILPALAFWSFSWVGDFLHFSSELVALLLISSATWCGVASLTAERPRYGLLGCTGSLLALVPLAKLQATPLALAMGLGGLCILGWQRPPRWIHRMSWLAGGALLVAVVLLVYLVTFGLIPQFWYSYVVSNLDYTGASSHPLAEMPNHFFAFMTTGQSFAWFFYGSLAFTLLQAQRTWQIAPRRLRVALIAGWIMVAVSYLCVLAPGRQVAHYLLLLVVPLTFLGALHLATPAVTPGNTTRPARIRLFFFVLMALIPQAVNRAQAVQEQLGRMPEFKARPISDVGGFIRERQKAGEKLTVWGWNPQLNVETQMPHGTREAHSAFQIMRGPLREFYRTRYLRDFLHSKPAWFVDAVGPGCFGFEHREVDGHETFPELAETIHDGYVLLTDLDSMRIYRRVR